MFEVPPLKLRVRNLFIVERSLLLAVVLGYELVWVCLLDKLDFLLGG